MHIDKKPLPLDKYDQYGIDQQYQGFIITLLNVTQDQIDQYEQDLILKGQKLFHADMVRVDGDKFNVTLIIGLSSVISNFKN